MTGHACTHDHPCDMFCVLCFRFVIDSPLYVSFAARV